MNSKHIWAKEIEMYEKLIKNNKLNLWTYKKNLKKINILYKKIYNRIFIEKTRDPSISIDMVNYLNSVNLPKISQPGSLNKIYFYQFDKNKKYRQEGSKILKRM